MRRDQRALLRYLILIMTHDKWEGVNLRSFEREMEETYGELWYEFRDDALNEEIR